jgi:hypothetical protein
MKHCTKCGSKVNSADKFCANCGTPVGNILNVSKYKFERLSEAFGTIVKNTTFLIKKNSRLFILLVILVLFTIVAVNVYEYMSNKEAKDFREKRTIHNVLGRHDIDYIKVNDKYLTFNGYTKNDLFSGWPYSRGSNDVDSKNWYDFKDRPSESKPRGYVKITKDKILIVTHGEYHQGLEATLHNRRTMKNYPLISGQFEKNKSVAFSRDVNDGKTKMPLQSSDKNIIFYYHFLSDDSLFKAWWKESLSYELDGHKYQIFF